MAIRATDRRGFLVGSIGLASAALGFPSAAAASGRQARRRAPARLGVASYSLREFDRATAIGMLRELGVEYVNLKSVHLDYDLPPAELQQARREVEAAGLSIVGGGTITFEADTDAGVRRYFDYARLAGMPLIVATAEPTVLPRIERFARDYDIQVAIHNHGPEDRWYPSPYDVLRHVGEMHPNMGVCLDVGHSVRAGTDVVRAIADLGPRLLDVHMKDLADLDDRGSQVVVGQGRIPIAAILRQLDVTGYTGFTNLEYEIDPNDPLPGMKESLAYMRGALAGLAEG